MKYRIMTDGHWIKIQYRVCFFFWKTIQRPEDLDNKDFGGDKNFKSVEEAIQYVEKQLIKPKYKQVWP